MSLVIKAIPFWQRRTRMFLAAVPLNVLHRLSIDVWNPKNVTGTRGYQRVPDENRIKKIAQYFERPDAIMPIAGLTNIREKGKIKYENGNIVIPDGVDLWVVDMQHRLKGLISAHENGLLRDDDFYFPVVITEGLTRIHEAAQFYIINTKAKRMDVALTRRLLIENKVVNEIADVKDWEIAAVLATISLSTKINNNPWFGAIRPPNEEKLISHIATEKSFVSSLRQIFIVGRFRQPQKIARRLASYWNAIKLVLPESFEEPKRFLIQKTPGIFTFNFFLAPYFLSKYKDKDFIKKLSGLRTLGKDFWKRSNKKGARRFGTGMGGYAQLSEHVKKHLELDNG